MEKQFKKIDLYTEKLLKEAGLQHPSLDFFPNVMRSIETKKISKPIVYKPLISKKMWVILFVASVVIISFFIIFPSSSETQLGLLNLNFEKLSFQLPELHFSKITIHGISFLGLFLLQIPFLKRQLNKCY